MSRFQNRSSMSSVDNFDDPRRSAERWDREKFERYRRGPEDQEVFKFQERETPNRREIDVLDRDIHRGPHGRVEERDIHFHEDDVKFGGPRRSRTDFLHEPTPSEVVDRALAPYRRRRSSVVEKDLALAIPPSPRARRPPRPQVIRRSSSVDTFDRRAYPQYGKRERDQWRPPTNTPIPLPIRRSPSRRGSRSRRPSRIQDEEFEEIHYKDVHPGREEYKDIHIHRERSRRRRRRSGSRYAESSISSESSFEEISPPRMPEPKLPGKRGRTKMPKRLVHIKAIEKLGYPYEEEEDFIFVKRALAKEQIDEIIEISKTYKETKTTFRYEEIKESDTADHHHHHHEPNVHEVKEVYKEVTKEIHAPPPPPSHHSHAATIRTVSPSRTVFEERIEESAHIGGPLTIVAPRNAHHHHRTTSDIKREISSLEAERRAIQLEREAESKMVLAERIRDGDYVEEYEWVERDRRNRDIVRVEKDRKGRMALVRSTH